jgi:hypothetical protein
MKTIQLLLGFLCFFMNVAEAQKSIDPTPEDINKAKKLREIYAKDDIAILESSDFISFDLN